MTHGRKACRSGDRCAPTTLADALYCAAHHSTPTMTAIAAALGVRPSYLADASNPDRDDTHFQARWLVPLMQVTDNLAPLRFLAAAMRCVLVPLPVTPATTDGVYQAFTAAVSEIGEDGAAIQLALADGHITIAEAERVLAELDDTTQALIGVKAAILARLDPATPARMTLSTGARVRSTSTDRRFA